MLKVWSKRHRDLSRSRNQVVCRLHAVLCDLIPGGAASRSAPRLRPAVLEQVKPSGSVQAGPSRAAAELLADLTHIDARLRETKKMLAVGVRASSTTLT